MTALLAAVVVGFLATVVVHEAGHAAAARLLGAKVVRVRWGWPVARVEADLPPGRGRKALFLLAGAGANVAVAAVAVAAGSHGVIVGAASAVFAVLTLVPRGTSDGAQLWALARETGREARRARRQ
ncbi:MAG: hypothetical protein FJ137_13870 [Deltaproteobacteria bacterium]|nr:hypothetical protein [Deltaproteobacteria bacterium]